MTSMLFVFIGALGAIIGSFLNVCVHRLPRQQSVAWPASRCPHCGHPLPGHGNIPVVSYLALRARCRACRAPISPRYPIIEAITSAMFLIGLWQYGPGPLLVQRLLFGCVLIVLFAIDLEHHLLPNSITLPAIAV